MIVESKQCANPVNWTTVVVTVKNEVALTTMIVTVVMEIGEWQWW